MASGRRQDTVGSRVLALWPVWLMYAALAAGVALGRVLETDGVGYLRWFTFFFVPMSALYCIPFGFLVGMVAQVRVWYTPRYAHRLAGVMTVVMLAIMLFGWAPFLFNHPDPTYALAVAWPTVASGLFMMLGMHMVRKNEYEQSAYDTGVDEYDDLDDWEDELDEDDADDVPGK